MAPSSFRVEVQPDREQVRVIPYGELDIATVPQLETEIAQLRSRGFASVVLDLRELTFMGSTGLRLLLHLHDESTADGFDFAILDCEGPVRELLVMTALAERFRYADG